eukprot:Gregarina_sp_Pseudo_9__1178@NODE_1775_length_1337_cov_12_160247_g1644_i0_p1_GENE_NODE_1775_length_1337_cov_12_160247_g1644_i0NODE_1775_length_1337_cov_12_160247_g1644_i0_p1_ORF_typecomplete_len429_score61_34Galactosyl_T/PF01762_21/1_6e08_NODE_1775_length_1337_cov_12_160247_g1644_i0181304
MKPNDETTSFTSRNDDSLSLPLEVPARFQSLHSPHAPQKSSPWILMAWTSAILMVVSQVAFALSRAEHNVLPHVQFERPDWAGVRVQARPQGTYPPIIYQPEAKCEEPSVLALMTRANESAVRQKLRDLYQDHLGMDLRMIFPVGRIEGALSGSLDLDVYTEALRFGDIVIGDYEEQDSRSSLEGDHLFTAFNFFVNSCPNGTFLVKADSRMLLNIPAISLSLTQMVAEGYFEHGDAALDTLNENLLLGRFVRPDKIDEPLSKAELNPSLGAQNSSDVSIKMKVVGGVVKTPDDPSSSTTSPADSAQTIEGESLLGGVLSGSFFVINRRLAKRALEQRLRFAETVSEDDGVLLTKLFKKTLVSFEDVTDLFINDYEMYTGYKEDGFTIDCLNWWWGTRNLTSQMKTKLLKLFKACTENNSHLAITPQH